MKYISFTHLLPVTYVYRFCSSCIVCQKTNAANKPAPAKLHPIRVSSRLFHRWGVDLVGPLNKSNQGNSYICVFTEYLTRSVPTKQVIIYLFISQRWVTRVSGVDLTGADCWSNLKYFFAFHQMGWGVRNCWQDSCFCSTMLDGCHLSFWCHGKYSARPREGIQ